MPLEPPRWTGQQQDRQYDKWSGDDREKKRPEKTHPAIDAEKSRQDAEDDIDDRFEHLPLSRRCPGLSAPGISCRYGRTPISCPPCSPLQTLIVMTCCSGANPTCPAEP